MKINYIKTVGFRKFDKVFETELYDITNITGRNRSGKSNILYAIVNIMLGTNLSGDEKSCLINKKCDSSYGELHFTDNAGIQHVLIRGRHKYSTKGNFASLDGKIVTQEALTSFYKDKKLFLSIINPLYFLNKKPAEQKELVDKYLSDIRPKAIFDSLIPEQQNFLLHKYYNNKKLFEELTEKEQEEFVNLKMLDIFMDIAYNSLKKDEQLLLKTKPDDIPSYISELNDDIKRSESIISTLDGKIEYAQNFVNQQLPSRQVFEKDEELTLARQELAFLTTNQAIVDKEKQKQIVEKLQKEILNKETECNELSKKMKIGKQKYLSIKNNECSLCPTCNQNIQDISKTSTIENLKTELVEYFNKHTKLQAELKDLEIKLAVEKCNYHALEGDTTLEKTKRIVVVEENIKLLEQEKQSIEKHNNEIELKQKNIKNAKLDIEKFNKEKLSQNNFIENLNKAKKVAQKLYISYIEEKMKLAKKHLKDVDIKFYSVLKTTGEIKEDFIITYKDTPLADLSRSETIATALEFSNMFNKITGANFPTFIDDYESCADYNFINQYSKNSQLLIAKVEKGHSLKISDASSDKYTIIKPVITGFKTINLYKNDVAEIKNAA